MDRVELLAKYLDVDAEDIKESYRDNLFETSDGDEYFVVTESEAYELAKEEVESFIDDAGIDGFTPDFQEWVYNNAVDEDFINDAIDEEIEYCRSEDMNETADALESYDFEDRLEYLKDMFSTQKFAKWIKDHNAIDIDAVADEAISWDGVAHFIAYYDGEEIELGDGLFAYRVN